MGKGIHRLTGADLKRRQPGMYADGGGLYLQVSLPNDTVCRSWVFRYSVGSNRDRNMGLGSLNTVSLAEARNAALECRKLRLVGIDPIEHRHTERAAKVAAS